MALHIARPDDDVAGAMLARFAATNVACRTLRMEAAPLADDGASRLHLRDEISRQSGLTENGSPLMHFDRPRLPR